MSSKDDPLSAISGESISPAERWEKFKKLEHTMEELNAQMDPANFTREAGYVIEESASGAVGNEKVVEDAPRNPNLAAYSGEDTIEVDSYNKPIEELDEKGDTATGRENPEHIKEYRELRNPFLKRS